MVLLQAGLPASGSPTHGAPGVWPPCTASIQPPTLSSLHCGVCTGGLWPAGSSACASPSPCCLRAWGLLLDSRDSGHRSEPWCQVHGCSCSLRAAGGPCSPGQLPGRQPQPRPAHIRSLTQTHAVRGPGPSSGREAVRERAPGALGTAGLSPQLCCPPTVIRSVLRRPTSNHCSQPSGRG